VKECLTGVTYMMFYIVSALGLKNASGVRHG